MALQNGELELHYQVQTSIQSGEVRGYEALLRWTHPQLGRISPDVFIPIAEENGMIIELGEWVLRTACEEAVRWDTPLRVAVNISAVQLMQVELPRMIHETLMETGLPASRLEIELTETAIFEDRERSMHVLRQIKALGVGVALDDFGTGYSSLEVLRSFPFDKIKLDRFFMHEIETSHTAKAMVRSVLALGKNLAIPVLAEGVETHSQLLILAQEGFDEMQGYLLGRPSRVIQPAQLPDLEEAGEALETSAKKTA
ncbi:MAG: EAL domain-containing protein [Hyphomonadaceae bacterium]|nr:EAL domain-containing protein [Hyphomonadaceae bacterium]